MAKVAVGVLAIADPLLQLLHVWKALVRFPVPDDLVIVGDHKDTAGSGPQRHFRQIGLERRKEFLRHPRCTQ